ncbi:uncharacterized protein N7469_001003 [Penicillium citrinum]|uniref:Nucleotide-diphospho-sugar transferase domain-containing protein n=1 Tax=Penicillium citrinum TaxID=5077 RepID=A0A9W9PDZ5_PENCI|nr:uncharacterized protein N7469_001003 [Penicillium citrinum]KAJ5242676.1 hypothetical protein N7469_001003 [Penicillium citrinum]
MLQLPFPSSPNGPRFQSLLGQKILVLDVDTRPLNNKGELLNSTWSSNETTLWATAGRLNHYLFAQLHGYDYKFVQMADLPGRFGTWSKVTAIRQYLPYYEFIVFMDADVIYPHPHVPLEWLFNYWDIIPENLVAMAIDPSYPINNDMRGRTLLNTGFIIAQRSPRTMELFEAWESCPTNARYNSCSTFSYDWPHEQGAFGNFLRYDFDRRDDIKSLSCSEANGCPEVTYLGCSGKLIRNYWGVKSLGSWRYAGIYSAILLITAA